MSSEAEQIDYQVTTLDLSHQNSTQTPPLTPSGPRSLLLLPPPLPHTAASASLSSRVASPLPPPPLPSHQNSILQRDHETDKGPPPKADMQLSPNPISSAMNTLQAVPAPESTASWGSGSQPSHPTPSSIVPKVDVPVDNQASLVTKAEPDVFQMKSELLDRLKREILGASSVKEGQGLLMMMTSSAKTSADDRASKTLLQFAGQNVDPKESPQTRFMTTELSIPGPSSSRTESISGSQSGGCSGQGKEELAPEGNLPKKIRHKKRLNGNKICLVCGDKALAHNFDVITCESCKAFFRRNALKSQALQHCMFQSNCSIDKNTRRFCPFCRLKKCFDIGMKVELMLDEEERRLRRDKKAQRVRQRVSGNNNNITTTTTTTITENSGQFLAESSHTGAIDSETSCSPENSTPDFPSQRYSLSDPSQQRSSQGSSPGSYLHPPSLPAFHTLQDPGSQTPPCPAAQSSAYTRSFTTVGVTPGMTPTQPASPFTSLLTQLSTTSSPVSFTPSLAAAQPNPASSLPQSQSAFGTGSGSLGLSSSVESSSSHQKNQGPEEQRQQQPRREEESMSRFLEPTPSLNVENSSYPLPGPAARIFKHVPRDQLPSDPFMYWIMSPEERLILANLTNAYQEVLLSLQERGVCRNTPITETYLIHDFLNEIDDAMYKIVQFSKHIADFRQMRKEDQIAMLKSSTMHTFGIACCAAYVHERDCWLSLRGDLTLSHLRKLTNDDPYIQVGVEYCRSVKSLVKNDFTVYALVHCMILFDPRDAKMLDRQVINQTRDKYVIMLKHYLESQYSYLYADEYFVAIQERVREMFHLAKTGNAMFKRYSSAFQPLITEMLSST